MKKLFVDMLKDFLLGLLMAGLFFVCAASLFSGLVSFLIVMSVVAVIGAWLYWWEKVWKHPLL